MLKPPLVAVFLVPVDVVALNIPDYMAVIGGRPMDLGSVKERLRTNWYATVRDFVCDVRLTFRNAQLYNPPAAPHPRAGERDAGRL